MNILLHLIIVFHQGFNYGTISTNIRLLLEAEGSIRSAIKSAAVNEKPLVVTQISKLLYDIESLKEFEQLQDIVDAHMKKRDE